MGLEVAVKREKEQIISSGRGRLYPNLTKNNRTEIAIKRKAKRYITAFDSLTLIVSTSFWTFQPGLCTFAT